jgi:thioredoxin-dependent peroxiredoxin
MTLAIGDLAPEFSLSDADGNLVKLSALRGKTVILYFYPRDLTPGCNKEACGFRDLYDQLPQHNALVFGVSTDDAKSHAKFIQKFELPFPLLCDPEAQVATLYESYGLKKFMGKEYMGIMRHTFVIDPEGKIARIYLKVKPETHAAQVIEELA